MMLTVNARRASSLQETCSLELRNSIFVSFRHSLSPCKMSEMFEAHVYDPLRYTPRMDPGALRTGGKLGKQLTFPGGDPLVSLGSE